MVTSIRDHDLSLYPQLPLTHKDYEKRRELRIKLARENEQFQEKRLNTLLRLWTTGYKLLKQCTEKNAPLLSRMMYEQCNMEKSHNLAGGFMDGPRAYDMVRERCFPAGAARKASDKEYYKTAERLATTVKLADGCTPSEYDARALAFLQKVVPFLPQAYSQDDISEFLLELMPPGLRAERKMLRSELQSLGRYHDHMYLTQRCSELVDEQKKTKAPGPTVHMVAARDLAGFDINQLSGTCGIALSIAGYPSLGQAGGLGTGGTSGGGRKGPPWCDGCPHPTRSQKGECLCNPEFDGEIPASLFVNKERLKAVMAQKKANADASGLRLATMKNPSKEVVDKFKQFRKDRDARRQKAREEKAGGTDPGKSGGAAVDGDCLREFLDGLEEVSGVALVHDADICDACELPESETPPSLTWGSPHGASHTDLLDRLQDAGLVGVTQGVVDGLGLIEELDDDEDDDELVAAPYVRPAPFRFWVVTGADDPKDDGVHAECEYGDWEAIDGVGGAATAFKVQSDAEGFWDALVRAGLTRLTESRELFRQLDAHAKTAGGAPGEEESDDEDDGAPSGTAPTAATAATATTV